MSDYPTDVDQETLRAVTEELVEARILLALCRRGLSSRAPKSLDEGAYWVRLDRGAARALLEWRP